MRHLFSGVLLALLLVACGQSQDETAKQPTTTSDDATAVAGYQVPVEYFKLDNGLKVVLSQDKTTPVATVAVYYNIGFRIEPKDRTGFAHLFEHMMFQGSENLGKMEFVQLVQRNGGVMNGSTRFDFTNYFEIVPSHKLETVLWAEADRMRSLDITQENLTNQQGVVTNEVKVNVLNQPYGGFPWLDLPQYANTNWYNAHNFYGDLADLEAATLEDVQAFFDAFYAPNNAALVVVGDFDPDEALALLQNSLALFQEIDSEDFLAEVYRHMAEAHLGQEELDEALGSAQRSLTQAQEQEMRLEEGATRRVLGQVHLSRQELARAERELQESLHILQALNSRYEMGKTLFQLARLCQVQGDQVQMQENLRQARTIFEDLGAGLDLAQARELALE